MSVNKQGTFGKIKISKKAIKSLVADAALSCYGVAGISKKDNPKILAKEELGKVIDIHEEKEGYEISFNIVLVVGIKVTEILRSVQKEVKYIVEKSLDICVAKVNIFVQDLMRL